MSDSENSSKERMELSALSDKIGRITTSLGQAGLFSLKPPQVHWDPGTPPDMIYSGSGSWILKNDDPIIWSMIGVGTSTTTNHPFHVDLAVSDATEELLRTLGIPQDHTCPRCGTRPGYLHAPECELSGTWAGPPGTEAGMVMVELEENDGRAWGRVCPTCERGFVNTNNPDRRVFISRNGHIVLHVACIESMVDRIEAPAREVAEQYESLRRDLLGS